ncbi:MAG: molybdopterin-dependent oxidoreductase, partial [Dehalococcoidia bacterium]|nr:molybdopterin-dependent oxidoreductase [Dehalococcoidia bacterium]
NPAKRTNAEKGIGVDPKWVEISWEEALETIAEKMRKIRSEDPRKLILGGIDFQNFLPVWTFASAFGTPNLWKGASDYYCGNNVHPILYMAHGAFYADPDLRHCNYCLLVGTQTGFMVNSNANIMTQEMADARMRGLKVVVVDPIGNNAAAKADEWVPIRPGTDAALMLGMLNILLNELGIYDAQFLRKHTNGPYLVGPDGLYVRDEEFGKPLIWDELNQQAKVFDASDVGGFALEGTYQVKGIECRPAFQLLKDHVKAYTLEKVSQITTVPAPTIRRLAKEFGEAARVGSTIVVEGKELPYRPACAHWNRGVSAHKHAMLTGWSIELLNIVVGAIDVPGGLLGCNPVGPFWAPHEGPDGLIVPSEVIAYVELAYPARKIGPPESLELRELFPVAP